ncbi:MAG TPA: 50S ribosomal protein L9 [bacterium]
MDVILLSTMEHLGPEGKVVSVKPGYARNYLLPRKLAVAATPEQRRAFEEQRRRRDARVKRALSGATALKQQIEGRSLTLKLSLGEDDKPFGAVTTHDVIDGLAQEGITVDRHAVELEEPIKSLGIYDIPVRIHPDVTATLKLWVVKS